MQSGPRNYGSGGRSVRYRRGWAQPFALNTGSQTWLR